MSSKILTLVIGGAALAGAVGVVVSGANSSSPAFEARAPQAGFVNEGEPGLVTVVSPGDLLAGCDAVATHPDDPMREAVGIPDASVIPQKAIRDCEAAVAANGDVPRAHFQLGRALSLANRKAEAIDQFALAGEYGAAQYYLGNAYRDGDGVGQSFEMALNYYLAAKSNGFAPSGADAAAIEAFLVKNTFVADAFQKPHLAQMIYSGDFSSLRPADHFVFSNYLQGMVAWFDSDQAMDHSPYCAPLLTWTGNVIHRFGPLAGLLSSGATRLGQGEYVQLGLDYFIGGPEHLDAGRRDAQRLINLHGCDSIVGERLVTNLGKGHGVLEQVVSGLAASTY